MVEAAALTGRLPQLAKYEALEEIGHGGMATVYRARDKRLGREVALKVIHPHLRNSTEVASRFFAEAKAVAKLRHPNIVEIYDVSAPDEPDHYLVAELVRGTTLRHLRQRCGPMPPEVAAAIAIELLSALAHANATGVVHRDVKPENVLIEHRPKAADSEGAEDGAASPARVAVKLTDFGIAKLLDAQGVTSTGQVLGSPAHMAPEQIEGAAVDARSDIFGLGVLLYECMVDHLPFEGTNPAQVLRRVLEGRYAPAQTERPLIGSRWSALLDMALAHAPGDRFSSAGAMSAAITAELERLDFASPLRELTAFLDSPADYEAAYQKRIVDRLCTLGDAERRSGNSLLSASDYNRALAYAPDDPHLMRIVAGLNRAESRARVLRRAGIGLALMTGIGASGVLVHHVVAGAGKASPRSEGKQSQLLLPVSPPVAVSTAPAEVSTESASSVVTQPPPTSIVTALHAHEVALSKPTERTLSLDLKPPMGVDVTVDGEPSRAVSSGDALSVDNGAHSLVFTCPVCVPVQVALAPGDKSDRIVVSVPIKPAILVIEGDQSKTYQVVQRPELTVRIGWNTIMLKSAFEHVTVRQIESAATISVRLEAGKTIRASFD